MTRANHTRERFAVYIVYQIDCGVSGVCVKQVENPKCIIQTATTLCEVSYRESLCIVCVSWCAWLWPHLLHTRVAWYMFICILGHVFKHTLVALNSECRATNWVYACVHTLGARTRKRGSYTEPRLRFGCGAVAQTTNSVALLQSFRANINDRQHEHDVFEHHITIYIHSAAKRAHNFIA